MTELPITMRRANTCCFTGHRFLPADRFDEIRQETERAVQILIQSGYRYFICGGALGYDTVAAQTVLLLKETYPAVHLVLALPCRNQTDKWLGTKKGEDAIREYQRIKGCATVIHYIRDFYEDGCMKERNQWMVEHASFCIAYYNGAPRSGAGQTYRMAKDTGMAMYNVYDGNIENEDADEKIE